MQNLTNRYVARVHLMEDTTKKDYYFRLYVDEQPVVDSTTYAVVEAKGMLKVGRVLEVIETQGLPVVPTKEVVALINTAAYEQRRTVRKQEQERTKRKKAICAELDAALLGKKDVAYYRCMAQILEMSDEQKQLIDELLQIELEEGQVEPK